MHLQQYNLQESLNDYKYNKLLQAKTFLTIISCINVRNRTTKYRNRTSGIDSYIFVIIVFQ